MTMKQFLTVDCCRKHRLSLFCLFLTMLGAGISAIVIFLYLHFHVAIGHEGHDHGISARIDKSFITHEVIPDVVDAAPSNELNITYNDGGNNVNYGEVLTPTIVKNLPKLEWNADPNAFYSLIMTDPDAPSRKEPKFREFLHWLVVNIPGNDLEKGETLTEYIGSGPPKGTGLHRYVFLIYKQTAKHDFNEPFKSNTNANRGGFSTKKFTEQHGLGSAPVAGNFYQAEYDDYVPILHKQFTPGP